MKRSTQLKVLEEILAFAAEEMSMEIHVKALLPRPGWMAEVTWSEQGLLVPVLLLVFLTAG
jgi:hypothetical protein